jgi:hypothetical protein
MLTAMVISAKYNCAYCGSINEVEIDPSAGHSQEYEEDCQTCCSPNLLRVELWTNGRGADVFATRDDGS